MLPLYHDLHFTLRFGDDRIIPRFHLEGVGAGRRVSTTRRLTFWSQWNRNSSATSSPTTK
jgi:hypothetical protein